MNTTLPETDAGHLRAAATHIYQTAINDQERSEISLRPSYIFKPRLRLDGNKWCALYGDNLQDGVAGFGDSPEIAYADFDKQWRKPLTTPASDE